MPLQEKGDATDIEVTVDGRMAQTSAGVIALLREKTSGSAMPIFIGPAEARAILFELEGVAAPRPLTHDLLKNILIDFNAAVTKAVVAELKNDVFYGVLHLEADGRAMTQDCRPSDAIALALRFGTPIFVKEDVWIETISFEGTKRLLELFDRLQPDS